MNKKFSNYPNYVWLIFFVFYFLLSNTNAQIYDGTYTGTFSGSIIKEYDAGKTKITTTPKQISFIVSTKNGLQIDGEIVGEWEYLGEMYGKPSIEKKDWSKSIMICRTDLADSSALSKIKLLNFSCQGHAYIDVITLTGTISNGLMTGKWQIKDTPTASGTFQATTSSNSTLFPKPETRIDSGVRFSSVSGQVEIWHENETENDSRIAKIDTVLYEGDHIKTAEDATCILSFADMSNFVMKSESEIILAKTKGPESKLKLVLGNIWVNVKHMIKYGSMEVDMSQGVAGIKGTKFEVWEDSSRKESTLRVEEGTVEFRHKVTSKTMLITAGQTVKATPKGFISVEAINVDKATKKTLDSVVTFDNGKAYIFSGNQYIRFDIALDRADSGYPKPLSQWSLPWVDRIDEAVNWGNGKVYIFKGSQFVRFDIKADRVDEGYPKPLSLWRLPWTDGIDAAVNWGNEKVYIFKGSQYIRFDIKSDRVDEGYPKSLSLWGLPWTDGIDAAVNWGNGKVYIFKGSQFVRFDINADRVDEGYPKPINNETWNGLQFFFE